MAHSETTTDDAGPIGYADALAELETILDELEADDVDVDLLAVRVARAADLVELCRTRIGSARTEVERIVARLDDLEGEEIPNSDDD
ncbi:MAG: exodeoxyribonuclease VII small subunit [Actinomycetia bacterium]|nr:exodeoxyribonuclease VII small subunit [Actinomycetes bacterium]